MSKVVAQLSGADVPTYRLWLQKLEKATGSSGTDIRLTLQIAKEVREKISQLGLDPADTTGVELYKALYARLVRDDAQIQRALQVETGATPQLFDAITNHFNNMQQKSGVVVIKSAVAKKILKKLHPKQTMKLLGYRSLDSMLKHESVAAMLAAAHIAESPEWHAKRLAEYSKLVPSNFETKRVQFMVPSGKKWPDVAKQYTEQHRDIIMSVPELGTVLVLPLTVALPALTTTTIMLCVRALSDIRARSAYLKLQQVRPDFEQIFAQTNDKALLHFAQARGRDVSWQTLHWFYGSEHNQDSHPELFEPHVQPEDMWIAEAEQVLLDLDPELSFWRGTHFLGLLDGKRAVSLNILDIALSVCNVCDYTRRVTHYMQQALQREVMGRYLAHPVIHKEVSQKLDTVVLPDFSTE